MTQLLYIDAEFKNSNESPLTLVCISVRLGAVSKDFWLYENPENQARLKQFLLIARDTCVLVCYQALAESRALIALGLDPSTFRFIDLYVAWKLFSNGHPDFFKKTKEDKEIKREDNLLFALKYLKIIPEDQSTFFDATYKADMRDLILTTEIYTPEMIKDIQAYCRSDIEYLPQLLLILCKYLKTIYEYSPEYLSQVLIYLSSYTVALARCEEIGIPINRERVENLAYNYQKIHQSAVDHCNQNYPFYAPSKKGFTCKYQNLWQFITEKGLETTWVRTPSGKFTMAKKYLEYLDIPEIQQLLTTKTIISQIGWFREKGTSYFYTRYGKDDCVRPFYGPYRTLTSRNGPRAREFVFAMSSWLRALVQAPEGYTLTSMDYSKQEFYLGAILSGDEAMLAAYTSGDFYLAFAKLCGMIPSEATADTHPLQRQQCKSTVLGLQYGMQAAKLASKLSSELGRDVPLSEAEGLVNLHKQTFPAYWKWLDRIDNWASMHKPLILPDGWALQTPWKSRKLTYRNFYVQGTGAVILRNAVLKVQKRGLCLISMVHDSLIIRHRTEDKESPKILRACMEEAVQEVTGRPCLMTIDESAYDHNTIWVDKKGEKNYAIFGKYLLTREHVS